MSKTHGLTKHPLYKVWMKMKERCYGINSDDHKDYGAKGVVVCKVWLNKFKTFYDWSIANGWQKGLQIDKDIKGNGKMYSPSKCCFVTSLENNRHQSTTKLTQEKANKIRLLFASGKYTQGQLAERFGVKQPAISVVVLNKKWHQSDYIPPELKPRKPRGNVENSIMNQCRKYGISYWAVIDTRKRRDITLAEALNLHKEKQGNIA